jgi:hypothetical protein
MRPAAAIDLYWLPLGAGGRSVKLNGRACERLVAFRDHRQPSPLFHSAMAVEVDGERSVIEMTPVLGNAVADRGVVAGGAVGSRLVGRSNWFRYEVRCWQGGSISDVAEAVSSPVRLSQHPGVARRLIALVPSVPTPVWGRDELRTGGMWNSNSLTSWLIASAGIPVEAIRPPAGGRAPGWHAGCVAAKRTGPGTPRRV